MKNLSLNRSLAMIAIGLIAGLTFSLFFKGCANDPAVIQQKIIPAEELKKQAESKEAAYKAKITELEVKNQQLQTELKTAKDQLASVKSKARQRETTIKKLIEPKGFSAKDLLEKVKPSALVDTSASSSLTPCDSLAQEVSQYILENAVKDSIYELQVSTLDSIVAVKDSVIKFKTELHDEWVGVFTIALDQQKILEKENQQLRKQIKRQKRKSKFISAGLFILSAIGTKYLLNH